jgi:branched-chain amino acid aminotransferase
MMYYDATTTVFKDGRWIKASEAKGSDFNQSLHYGNGVFEGMRAYENANGCNIFKAKDHFDRLLYSADRMQLKVPYSSEELVQIAYQLLDHNNMHNAYIRPLVYAAENMSLSPAPETAHVFMAAWKWAKYLGSDGLNIMVSSFERPNPRSTIIDAKITGHYTNSILATTEAKKLGYDEALLLDMNGHVAEAPGANFFFEKDDILYTPPAGHILPGITRRTVMNLAEELGIRVVEKFFTIDEVYQADHAFFCGTAVEIAPIASINGEKLPGNWEESAGHNIYLMYRQKVQFNEYQGLTIV